MKVVTIIPIYSKIIWSTFYAISLKCMKKFMVGIIIAISGVYLKIF